MRLIASKCGPCICVLWLASLAVTVAAQRDFPALATNDTAGFEQIFDGKSLAGWEGDPTYWRVEDGCIVGEITPATVIKTNTFLIWKGGTTKDFELKVDYRISERGNSGLNYRSTRMTNATWRLRGYQADIDGTNQWTGQNYEEMGRTFLALRGQISRVDPDGKPRVVGTLGEKDELAKFIHNGDWNQYHLIVQGNTMIHILNGHVMSVVVDDDTKNRLFDGLLGVQVHVGPPMKIEYRNFLLKTLPVESPSNSTKP